MARIEDLAEIYGRHIEAPWQTTIAGPQRVLMVLYEKELERTLRARKDEFATRTRAADHAWIEVDLTDTFASWLCASDYREAYFEAPEDLSLKLETEFPAHVAGRIRAALQGPEAHTSSVVAVFGVGCLFGLTRMSHVVKLVERDIRGRLAVFFPGHLDQNNYRLLDAQDGWNYMAVPITAHGTGGVT